MNRSTLHVSIKRNKRFWENSLFFDLSAKEGELLGFGQKKTGLG
jgi:hypothetical protein